MKSAVTFFRALPILLSLLFAVAALPRLAAQTRMSDKDVEQLMKNMNQDSKKFQSLFDSAVSKSVIRKTSQEKDARKLVDSFQKGTKTLYDHFKQTKKSDPYLQNSLDSAAQVDKFLHTTQLDADTNAQWARVHKELHDLAAAFNMPGH
jgi:hypothetical protein